MIYSIKVEQRHIDMGIPCSGSKCAIALAIKELIPDAIIVDVCEDISIVFPDEKKLVFRLPYDAEEFMESFDDGDKVKPIEFQISSYQRKKIL